MNIKIDQKSCYFYPPISSLRNFWRSRTHYYTANHHKKSPKNIATSLNFFKLTKNWNNLFLFIKLNLEQHYLLSFCHLYWMKGLHEVLYFFSLWGFGYSKIIYVLVLLFNKSCFFLLLFLSTLFSIFFFIVLQFHHWAIAIHHPALNTNKVIHFRILIFN